MTIFEDPAKAGRASSLEIQEEEELGKNLQGLAITDEVQRLNFEAFKFL